jgi:hypothetical protein
MRGVWNGERRIKRKIGEGSGEKKGVYQVGFANTKRGQGLSRLSNTLTMFLETILGIKKNDIGVN